MEKRARGRQGGRPENKEENLDALLLDLALEPGRRGDEVVEQHRDAHLKHHLASNEVSGGGAGRGPCLRAVWLPR